MGRFGAEAFQQAVRDGDATQEQAIEWHLRANCYPPVSLVFIPLAVDAINRANQGDWSSRMELPNGKILLVCQVIEGLHLEGFLEPDPDPL